MISWKFKIVLQTLVSSLFLFSWTASQAAQLEILWGKIADYPFLKTNLFQLNSSFVDHRNTRHVRYDQYYQGLPVYGMQVIYHIPSTKNTSVTGMFLQGIEKDINNLTGKISLDDAKRIANEKNNYRNVSAEKIIFFDQGNSNKALLAYYIVDQSHSALLSYIIDANQGKILQQWDALAHLEDGQGVGGIDFKVDKYFRDGSYQFGHEFSVPGFGLMEIQHNPLHPNTCVTANPIFQVFNLENQSRNIPLSYQDEKDLNLQPFYYHCFAPQFLNINDNGFAPIRDAYSPINEANYFIMKTYMMLVNEYNVASPIDTTEPLHVYTHVNDVTSFACGSRCMHKNGFPQIVLGNGNAQSNEKFAPFTSGDIAAHEFAHIVTEHYSNLDVNPVQAGAINEAFSDMTAIALNNYLRNVLGYTWYWDGADWSIGKSISRTVPATPLRYVNNPTLDGHSIDNAQDYTPGMSTSYASGVYNKLFYLLSAPTASSPPTSSSIERAYRVMLEANMTYWMMGSDFRLGACGIIAAATKQDFPQQLLQDSLKAVKIACPFNQKKIASVLN